jgi:hypothetical protein
VADRVRDLFLHPHDLRRHRQAQVLPHHQRGRPGKCRLQWTTVVEDISETAWFVCKIGGGVWGSAPALHPAYKYSSNCLAYRSPSLDLTDLNYLYFYLSQICLDLCVLRLFFSSVKELLHCVVTKPSLSKSLCTTNFTPRPDLPVLLPRQPDDRPRLLPLQLLLLAQDRRRLR